MKNLGLNVRRAKVGINEKTGNFRHKFYITDAATRSAPPPPSPRACART